MSSPPPGYLVRYGVAGLLGYFVSEKPGTSFDRAARVIVRSDRGWEAGTVLCPSEPHTLPSGLKAIPGVLLRALTPSDEQRLDQLARQADDIFAAARTLPGLPVEIMDVEVVADPDHAILHILRLGPVDLDSVRTTLAAQRDLEISIEDVTSPAAAEAFASDCADCGSGCADKKDGEGCSGGSCGSGCGSKRDFDAQWRAYFAELRQKMESRS